MREWIGRIFRVQRGEWPKVLLFAALGLLLQAGIAISISVSDAIFLTRLGADYLPHVYMLIPVLMLVCVPLYTAWIVRAGIDRVFRLTMLGIAIGACGFFSLFALPQDVFSPFVATLVVFLVKIWPFALLLALSTLYWNMIEGYFDLLAAKRLFAFFSGGLATGAACGGLVVSGLSGFAGLAPLFLVWAGLCLLTLPIAARIRRSWQRYADADETDGSTGFSGQLRLFGATVRRSRYVLMVHCAIGFMFFLTTLAEYQYLNIFSSGKSERELAALFGTLFMLANAFNLVVNFFFFNRLAGAVGVRNLMLVQPVVYAACFLFLSLDRSFGAAVFAFFAYQGVLTAIELNNINFVFNAIAADIRRQVRAFAEGISDPVATALAGLLLFLSVPGGDDGDLARVGLFVALGYLVVVFVLRHEYRGSLLSSLRREWLDLSRLPEENFASRELDDMVREFATVDVAQQAKLLDVIGARTPRVALGLLLERLERTEVGEQQIFAPVLERLLGSDAPGLWRAVRTWERSGQRVVADSLRAIFAARVIAARARPGEGSPATGLFGTLEHGDERARSAALRACARVHDIDMLPRLLDLCPGFTPAERRTVASIATGIGAHSVPTLVSVLCDPARPVMVRAIAARVLARVAFAQFAQLAGSLIDDEIDAACRAANAGRSIGRQGLPGPARRVLALCHEAESGQRIRFVLELLALAGRVGDVELMIASLDSDSPRHRANAIESLEQDIPRRVFKKILPLLDGRARDDAAFAARRSRVDTPEREKITWLSTKDPLLQAAVLQIIADDEGPEALFGTGVALLEHRPTSLVRQTLRILLERVSGRTADAGMTPVEKADLIARCDIFSGLGIDDLVALVGIAVDARTVCAEARVCRVYGTDRPRVAGIEAVWEETGNEAGVAAGDAGLVFDVAALRQLVVTRASLAMRCVRFAGGMA